MKTKLSIAIACILIGAATQSIASNADTTALSREYYNQAKNKLVEMLDGKKPLSYERAIYLIEDAYWNNRLNPTPFKSAIDYGTQLIKEIAASNTAKAKDAPLNDVWAQMHSMRAKEEGYFDKAKANWAIFSYMTDTIKRFENGTLFYKEPYRYSYKDPLGTTDWSNTQVTHLLVEGNGNCFALASLFKIYADRLNTDADICTAPGHVYITHRDGNGTYYNIEVTSKSFPGTGTMETLTYTTDDAVKNDISLRQLNLQQSVALCLVYLAKGYEYKFKVRGDRFALECAELALKYDSLNLNAMLLKAEVLETSLVGKNKPVYQLQADNTFKEYQRLVGHLYRLGYREMPLEMKNLLIKGWSHDTSVVIVTKNHTPKTFDKLRVNYNRFASLSWGLFDEEIPNKPIEKYSRTMFDTKKKRITQFVKEDVLYNDYNFDPVVFALNVDPMAYKYPGQSPYAAFDNSPIWKNDPTGASGEVTIDKQSRVATVQMNVILYGTKATQAIATSTARDIANSYNAAHGTVNIGGETYTVRFEVAGSYINSGSGSDVMQETRTASTIFGNTDVKNNYYRVEGTTPNGTSSSTHLGNDGILNYSQIAPDGSTTEAHEAGHGLGLEHNSQTDWQSAINGKPDLMDVAGDKVQDKYKAGYALPDGTLDISKRQVSQKNINNIFTPGVKQQLQNSGKANIGSATDSYYMPNGQEVKKPQ